MTTSTFPARVGDLLTWDSGQVAVLLVLNTAEAIKAARQHLGQPANVTLEYQQPAERPKQLEIGGRR